jgi:hypothetical protein
VRLRLAAAAAALFSFALATPARADGEAWVWIENRIPILRTDAPAAGRIDWRVFTDFRANGRSEGLAQAFLRMGPLFYASSWLFIGTHGVIYSDRLANGTHDQEARIELEPNVFFRVGDFAFNDRNRGEYRWRDSGERYRYRNQLRISYAPKGALWIPFIWDEALVDLSGSGFNQNRASAGLGRLLTDTIRLDVGYIFRSRKESGDWSHDHVLNLYLYFDVPPKVEPKAATDPPAPPLPVDGAPPPAPSAPSAPATAAPPPPSPPPPPPIDGAPPPTEEKAQ